MKKIPGWVLAAVLLSGMAACREEKEFSSIGSLLDDPARHDHEIVRVVGRVEEAAGALGYGIYRVNDGTGTIMVLSRQGGAPRSGATVGIEGEFRSAYTFGDKTGAALVEKHRFTPKE